MKKSGGSNSITLGPFNRCLYLLLFCPYLEQISIRMELLVKPGFSLRADVTSGVEGDGKIFVMK